MTQPQQLSLFAIDNLLEEIYVREGQKPSYRKYRNPVGLGTLYYILV